KDLLRLHRDCPQRADDCPFVFAPDLALGVEQVFLTDDAADALRGKRVAIECPVERRLDGDLADQLGVANEQEGGKSGHVEVLQVGVVVENEIEDPERGAKVTSGDESGADQRKPLNRQRPREWAAAAELIGDSRQTLEESHGRRWGIVKTRHSMG